MKIFGICWVRERQAAHLYWKNSQMRELLYKTCHPMPFTMPKNASNYSKSGPRIEWLGLHWWTLEARALIQYSPSTWSRYQRLAGGKRPLKIHRSKRENWIWWIWPVRSDREKRVQLVTVSKRQPRLICLFRPSAMSFRPWLTAKRNTFHIEIQSWRDCCRIP